MKARKTTLWFITAFLSITFNSYLQAQELKVPGPGKSLIYFVRSSGTGALVNFKYFHGDHYLGKFAGVNYFIYECDPGSHLFWAASENTEFLEAELLPEKVYLVEVKPTMGAIKASVKLIPISKDDVKEMERMNKLLAKKAPIQMDPDDISDEKEDLKDLITRGMGKYSSDKAEGKSIAKVLPENFHN